MLAEGMTLALATDLCPGCWLESMQLVMQLACRLYAFSPEEALLASTVNAARALGLADRGTLAPGKLADLQIWDVPTFEDVIYRLGNNAVTMVVKRGKVFMRNIPHRHPEWGAAQSPLQRKANEGSRGKGGLSLTFRRNASDLDPLVRATA